MTTRSTTPPNTPSHRAIWPVPELMITEGWGDYALLDSGHGRKLERAGRMTVIRPEPQAMWSPALTAAEWDRADAMFDADKASDDDGGRWDFARRDMPETWPMRFQGVGFLGRFTPFRHLGFFPEQATQWGWMLPRLKARVAEGGPPPRLLNLFGYTGVASLVAAAAGAEVVHVDASKKAVMQARENQSAAGLDHLPVRWLVEDARKFLAREVRRGNRYDAILLDPPKFGRGPKGEVWKLFDDLPPILADVAAVTAPDALFVILTAYATRLSSAALAGLMGEHMARLGGRVFCGEIATAELSAGRVLPTALFARWMSDRALATDPAIAAASPDPARGA
ncbi:class I SAM-dependent methyltransferase [Tistrella bauzanensis]|nr:class I SAM-dependent methyltransferase [Tistrella bauzanensis]